MINLLQNLPFSPSIINLFLHSNKFLLQNFHCVELIVVLLFYQKNFSIRTCTNDFNHWKIILCNFACLTLLLTNQTLISTHFLTFLFFLVNILLRIIIWYWDLTLVTFKETSLFITSKLFTYSFWHSCAIYDHRFFRWAFTCCLLLVLQTICDFLTLKFFILILFCTPFY